LNLNIETPWEARSFPTPTRVKPTTDKLPVCEVNSWECVPCSSLRLN
jgi:hypothetical protein